MGEIRKRRINYYNQWVFQPNTVNKMGDVWFTTSFLVQVTRMIATLKKRGFCIEQDMTDENNIVKHKMYLEACSIERNEK